MNISVQCCGIFLLLAILHFYTQQRKLRLHTSAAFFRLFMVSLISIFLDVLSLIVLSLYGDIFQGDYYLENFAQNRFFISNVINVSFSAYFPYFLINLVCKLYLCSLILTALSTLLYICRDIYVEKTKYKKLSSIYFTAACVGILTVLFLPINRSLEDPDHIFTYGPSVIATYVFCVSFLLMAIVFLSFRKKRMNILRWEAIRIWLVLWIGAAIIQFFRNELLLVSFAGAIGIMIVYLKLENPENNLDQKTGLFNRYALFSYIRQLYGEKKDFALLGFIIPHDMLNFVLSENGKDVQEDMVKYLWEVPNATAFRSEEDEILLLFLDSQQADNYCDILKNRFEFGWGNKGETFINPNWIFLPHANVAQQAEDLTYLIHHVRQNQTDYMVENTLFIDEAAVTGIYEEKRTEQLINSALENDRVEVFYQPIYSVKEKRFVSAEALVRIYTELGELVPPARFIEVAEKNGSIMKLGEVVFEKVCRFIRDDKPEQYGLDYVEVNLSVVQCAYEHLAENFIRIMKAFQVNPKMINLEITESSTISEKKTLLNNMKNLMEFGVEFSLDDFGTGNSNLNYIAEMPVNIVKFDRSMILSYFENGKAKYVMDAAMHMIQGMEMPIVSEGIETKEQLRTMEELGITYIQGYYFSKPLPKDEFLKFLEEKNKEQVS